MAETDFTSDVTAENGNNVEEEETTQEEPNPERKSKHISLQLHQIHIKSYRITSKLSSIPLYFLLHYSQR